MIKFKSGDIFNENVDAIVNTVNCVGVMGKGIALQCKNLFPKNYIAYKKQCRDHKMSPGDIFVFSEKGKVIINIAIKKHWRDPSEYDWIKTGLANLKNYIIHSDIKTIAIPAIGCGEGGPDWPTVKNEIMDILTDIDDKHIIVMDQNNKDISNIRKWKRCSCEIKKGEFDIDNIPLDCPRTWDLISSGHTTGIFQLETRLGQEWAAKVKPRNINDLSDLIALLRPSCLESGIADQYVARRHGKAKIEYPHESLRQILQDTYGVSVYQEQNIRIAKDLAGFSLAQADNLRKGIGKKDPKIISECRKQFMDGCSKVGIVSPTVAEEIFDWIEKAQRYQFNKAHSVSYAILGYQTAYIKCHFPVEFYISYLNYARYKGDTKAEIYGLVQDARFFNIEISPPDIRQGNLDFCVSKDNKRKILFGLSHIVGIGDSSTKNLRPVNTWNEFLLMVPSLHRNIAEALIRSGACDSFGISRIKMIKYIEMIFGIKCKDENGKLKTQYGLTKKEFDIFANNLVKNGDIIKSLEYLTFGDTKGIIARRKNVVKEIIECLITNNDKLVDTNTSKSIAEKHYLGIALSCSPADDFESDRGTHTCIDFAKELNGKTVSICCVIDKVRHTKTKRGTNPGQPMAILTISDSTFSIDSAVVFPDCYQELRGVCRESMVVKIMGQKRNGSLIVDDITRLI